MFARLKSNGKTYFVTKAPWSVRPLSDAEIADLKSRHRYWVPDIPHFGKSFIELQPLNPKTNQPWQASRRYNLDAVEFSPEVQ